MTNTTNNVSTKKGFTMIELIFVIVIIGILAAVAIPRLAATRDDAKVAVCSADVVTLMKDLTNYYTSQGSFESLTTPGTVVLSEITNVEATDGGLTVSGGGAGGIAGAGGSITYACDDKTTPTTAVTFTFSKIADGAGNLRVNMVGTVPSVTQGTVDGDLGLSLSQKNIANVAGINHAISGIRVKR